MKRPARVRIDKLLVDKGLIESREKAARQILAGEVFVDGQLVDKASVLVAPGAAVEVRARSPYVSRGGEKLIHALNHFQVKVAGRVCLDVGASTGGLPIVCCRRARRASTRSMWAPDNSTRASGRTRGSWSWSTRTL